MGASPVTAPKHRVKKNTSAPSDAERRAFGDLAEDIAYLRRVCFLIVAPFRDGYRVGPGRADDDVVDAEGLRARAEKERARRAGTLTATPLPRAAAVLHSAAPIGLATKTPKTMPMDGICRCGRPNSHRGRCWARRGWTGPGEGN